MKSAQRGFSLIELMIVIAIIGIIAAILIPNLEESRRGANEASAIGAMSSIYTAQILFQARHERYAASLAELGEGGLIDALLASGTKNGYRFETGLTASGFRARALPALLCETGRRFFYVDQTGIQVMRACLAGGPSDDPPPSVISPAWPQESEGCVCPRQGGDVSLAMVTQLRLLSPTDVVKQSAEWTASPKNVQSVLLRLDGNKDQYLGLDDILQADLLAIARQLAKEQQLPPGPTIGTDQELADALNRYRVALHAQVVPAGKTPPLPLASFKGDASKWLLSGQIGTHQSQTNGTVAQTGSGDGPASGEGMGRP